MQRSIYLFVLAACLNGCGDIWERATVTITYGSPRSGELSLMGSSRKRIQDAFDDFSVRNGYKCRANIKRTEEITCRGPKDLNLIFQPSLNKQTFVAKFSWADMAGRTHDEFMKYVSDFRDELALSFGEENVRIDVQT